MQTTTSFDQIVSIAFDQRVDSSVLFLSPIELDMAVLTQVAGGVGPHDNWATAPTVSVTAGPHDNW
jgi:hypothetical protein